MRVIGITGQSGSGKGELCAALTEYGYIHLDTDKIYHELLQDSDELKNELIRTFGEGIRQGDAIDCSALGAIVFAKENRKKLEALNKITHRYVCRECIRRICEAREQDAVGVLIDAPLLFEARLNFVCDCVVLVLCDPETRISRIMERDGISENKARARIAAQGDPFRFAAHCDLLFVNDAGEENIRAAAKDIHGTVMQNG